MIVLVAGGYVPEAAAQTVRPGANRLEQAHALSIGLHAIDFEYNGDADPDFLFTFQNPAIGLVYTQSNLQASVALGYQDGDGTEQTGDLRLIDVAFMTWGTWAPFSPDAEAAFRFFIPIALHSAYRRIDERNAEDGPENSFNVTVLGLGAGAGFSSRLGRQALLTMQAMPAAGVATRSFDSALGSSWLVNADAEVRLGPFVDRFGLVLGYRFRFQSWNVAASDIFGEQAGEFFDYRGLHHTLRIGVLW